MAASKKRLSRQLKTARLLLSLAALLGLWRPHPGMATVGMAEWDLKTPGTNVVCHADPFIAQHGTCLRPTDKKRGVTTDETVYVSRIEWWQYFKGHVVGKAQRGFFVFNETSKAVGYFDTEAGLQARLKQLHLDQPLTRRLTPADGWQLVWAPVMRQGLERLKKSDEYKKMSDAQRQAIEKQLEQYKEPDIRPTSRQ
jgi:hypothetical protein